MWINITVLTKLAKKYDVSITKPTLTYYNLVHLLFVTKYSTNMKIYTKHRRLYSTFPK